ncbi:methylenetetrahydrofolate reductase [Paeniglutamicibacter sp. ZC-3]|uniref:methylenetetrahydrofolate reductase n=1 Tax=Paeniglutamicibacter sp. ZC-3 TaxID=2986919 RepID=UPI0021F7E6C8|nr:methylenetetrahydrofolate reductase [Paeniglutamicibacter sp. ZC-3]MCV9993028.1 methylenetetrahydrofolate reductase [Paeniglutamicibacter sp. ZC-3]
MSIGTTAAPPSLSYELYPPANRDAAEGIFNSIRALEATDPDYVSVTYSGSPARRNASLELIEHLIQNTRLRPLAHLTCVGESRESLQNLIRHFVSLGVRGVLALRGDLPTDPEDWRGEFPFARYLIELIREVETDHSAALAGGRLGVGVAAYPIRHPESPSFEHDVEVLLAKERSGANYAITQVYFRANEYTNLVDSARRAGVTIPIIPGVIPLNSVRRLNRLASMAGIAPDPILAHALETAGSDSERHRIGVDAAVTLARRAFDDGAPGVHLYTFNDHRGSLDVIEQLELPRTRAQASNTWATRAAV